MSLTLLLRCRSVDAFECLVLGQHILLTAVPGHVVDARVLHSADDIVWQNALDLCSVHARMVALKALVPGDPAPGGVRDGDEALEDLGCAVVDLLRVAGELKDVFAVGAALGEELLLGSDNRADHAGAHVALLVRRDVGAALDHVGHIEGRVVGRRSGLAVVYIWDTSGSGVWGLSGVCSWGTTTLTCSARTRCSGVPSTTAGSLSGLLVRRLGTGGGR
jgi:hypothetical protein